MQPKIIAIVPVFNEEKVLIEVLDGIYPRIDHLIIINDGSTDSSLSCMTTWMRTKENVYCISLPKNMGVSAALLRGYVFLLELAQKCVIGESDLAIELDADGQHDPKYITKLYTAWLQSRVDVVQACRDFSNYPSYKVWGNKFLSLAAFLLSGFRYKDVESNYRIMQVSVYKDLIKYFTGYRYSGSFEVGIILGVMGKKIDNSVQVRVPYYRSGSSFLDGFHVLATGIWTRLKLLVTLERSPGEIIALKKQVEQCIIHSSESSLKTG